MTAKLVKVLGGDRVIDDYIRENNGSFSTFQKEVAADILWSDPNLPKAERRRQQHALNIFFNSRRDSLKYKADKAAQKAAKRAEAAAAAQVREAARREAEQPQAAAAQHAQANQTGEAAAAENGPAPAAAGAPLRTVTDALMGDGVVPRRQKDAVEPDAAMIKVGGAYHAPNIAKAKQWHEKRLEAYRAGGSKTKDRIMPTKYKVEPAPDSENPSDFVGTEVLFLDPELAGEVVTCLCGCDTRRGDKHKPQVTRQGYAYRKIIGRASILFLATVRYQCKGVHEKSAAEMEAELYAKKARGLPGTYTSPLRLGVGLDFEMSFDSSIDSDSYDEYLAEQARPEDEDSDDNGVAERSAATGATAESAATGATAESAATGTAAESAATGAAAESAATGTTAESAAAPDGEERGDGNGTAPTLRPGPGKGKKTFNFRVTTPWVRLYLSRPFQTYFDFFLTSKSSAAEVTVQQSLYAHSNLMFRCAVAKPADSPFFFCSCAL